MLPWLQWALEGAGGRWWGGTWRSRCSRARSLRTCAACPPSLLPGPVPGPEGHSPQELGVFLNSVPLPSGRPLLSAQVEWSSVLLVDLLVFCLSRFKVL